MLYTTEVAGFAAPPPDLRRAELIPPAARDAMHAAWNWGEYGPQSVSLHHLEGVTLAEEGLVFLPGLDAVPASITQHEPAAVEAARAAVMAADTAPELSGLHVLCIKRGASNYGHWLAEMLPMALLANRVLGGDVRFLVPLQGGALRDTIAASLALAGIAPERIVRLGTAPCRVRDLVMVHGLSLHGLYISPLVAELLRDLAAPVAPSFPGCRVWASRAGQPRSLWGERDLGTILHGMGWQVVNPGALPFREQIALFKGAASVAGVMGSGLANLVFAAPGVRVDLLTPAAMADTFFYLISCLRGLRYRELRCVQTEQSFGAMPWDGGLVVGLPELMAILG